MLLVDVRLHLRLDVVLELEHLVLIVQMLHGFLRPATELPDLEEPLFLIDLRVHIGGDEVDQQGWTFDVLDREARLRWDVGRVLDDVQAQVLHRIDEGLELLIGSRRTVLREFFHLSTEVWVVLGQLLELKTHLPLNDDRGTPIRHLELLHDPPDRSDLMEVLLHGVLHTLIVLSQDPEQMLVLVSFIGQFDRTITPHIDGDDHPRKEDGVPYGEDGKLLRDILRMHVLFIL